MSLTRELVEVLGEAIIVGMFVDERFPTEQEIALRYGAGRATVREAVKMLTAKGLLIGRSGQGTFVASEAAWSLFDPDILRWLLARRFSVDTFVQVTQMRLGAEPVAASLAAGRMTDPLRRQFQGLLDRLEAAGRGEENGLRAQIAFHQRLLAATQNPLYLGFGGLVTSGLTLAATFAQSARRPVDVSGYAALGGALLEGDGCEASARMQAMILDLLRKVEDVVSVSEIVRRPDVDARPKRLRSPWATNATDPTAAIFL